MEQHTPTSDDNDVTRHVLMNAHCNSTRYVFVYFKIDANHKQ